MFAAPVTYDAWMSKGVLGEKIFLDHRSEIAGHHRKVADLLAWLSFPGVVVMGIGLWQFWLDWVIFGAVCTAGAKLWFLDRMVWIYTEWQAQGRAIWGSR